MVIGAGKGGTAILNLLSEMKTLKTRVIIDKNLQAPGILIAKKKGFRTGTIGVHLLIKKLISLLM